MYKFSLFSRLRPSVSCRKFLMIISQKGWVRLFFAFFCWLQTERKGTYIPSKDENQHREKMAIFNLFHRLIGSINHRDKQVTVKVAWNRLVACIEVAKTVKHNKLISFESIYTDFTLYLTKFHWNSNILICCLVWLIMSSFITHESWVIVMSHRINKLDDVTIVRTYFVRSYCNIFSFSSSMTHHDVIITLYKHD